MRLIGLIGLIALVGCSGEVPGADAERPGQAIGFSYYEAQAVTRGEAGEGGEALTRGEVAQRTIPEGGCIGVYAYYHNGRDTDSDGTEDAPGTWSGTDVPDFMFNQRCTNNGGEYFVYAPLKYWPNETFDKISFIAYYPYTDTGISDPAHPESTAATGITPLMTNSTPGLPTFRLTVKDNPDEQTDFLVSDLCPNLPNGSQQLTPSGATDRTGLTITDRVHFYFRHAMAKVEFRIVVHPDIRPYFSKLVLNSLTLTNIMDQGTLTLGYDPSTGTSFAWTEQGTSSTDDDAQTYDINVKKAYLLMPQELADAAMLKLNYELTLKGYNSVYTYDDSGHPVLQDVYTYKNPDATVQLNKMKNPTTGTAVTSWLPNHHYLYTIRLNANRIEYTGQVVDWGDEDAIDDIPVEEK